jgi:uncharacterized radical SAM superfamily protein
VLKIGPFCFILNGVLREIQNVMSHHILSGNSADKHKIPMRVFQKRDKKYRQRKAMKANLKIGNEGVSLTL